MDFDKNIEELKSLSDISKLKDKLKDLPKDNSVEDNKKPFIPLPWNNYDGQAPAVANMDYTTLADYRKKAQNKLLSFKEIDEKEGTITFRVKIPKRNNDNVNPYSKYLSSVNFNPDPKDEILIIDSDGVVDPSYIKKINKIKKNEEEFDTHLVKFSFKQTALILYDDNIDEPLVRKFLYGDSISQNKSNAQIDHTSLNKQELKNKEYNNLKKYFLFATGFGIISYATYKLYKYLKNKKDKEVAKSNKKTN